MRTPILLQDGRVDTATLRIHRIGQPVQSLTPREGRLLDYLHERAGETVPRESLLVHVFEYAPGVVSRSIDTAIRRLRRKLECTPSEPRHLLSEYGVGYRLVPAEATATPARTEGLHIERGDLARAIDEAARTHPVITLWGAGGIGKTTALRRYIAARSGPRLWVDLSQTPAHARVSQHIAEVVGPPGATASTLRAWLDQTRGLLALDEAEGRQDEVIELIQAVLDAQPGPLEGTIAITSRQRLDLPSAWAVVVPPLSTEQGVELYRRRARQLGVELPGDTSLGQLIEALDGLALGIRLAASRVLLQSPEDQLAALRAGDGADDPSRRLHDTVTSSWDLLSPATQRLLSRLALFRSPFTTADVLEIGEGDVLDALADLVDASMVHRRDDGRLRLLTMVRTFVRRTAPADEAALEAWFTWMEGLFEELHQTLPQGLGRSMASLLPDLVAVLDGLHERDEPARAGALLMAAWPMLRATASSDTLSRLLHRARAHLDAHPLEHQAQILSRLGFYEAFNQWSPEGAELTERALELAAPVQDPLLTSLLAQSHGRVLWQLGRRDEAIPHLREAIAVLADRTDAESSARRGTAQAHLGVMVALADPARTDEGVQRVRQGIQRTRDRLPQIALSFQSHLARIHVERGQFDAAVTLLSDLAGRAEALGDRRQADVARTNLATCLLALGDAAGARDSLLEAIDGLTAHGSPYTLRSVWSQLAWAHWFVGDRDAALALVRRIGDARSEPELFAVLHTAQLALMEALGGDEAEAHARLALAEARQLTLERDHASSAPFLDMVRDALDGRRHRTRAAADALQAGELWTNAVMAVIGRVWIRALLAEDPAAADSPESQSSTGR